MKKIFTLIAVIAAWCGASAQTATYDFTQIEGFSSWKNSYTEHVVEYPEATVTFESASRQTGTITTMPVAKGSSVKVEMTNGAPMTSATIHCEQWGSKPQTITAETSADGETFVAIDGLSSTTFELTADNLPTGTKAVKFKFSNVYNQVGIASISINYEVAADYVAAPVFSPACPILEIGQPVTITCATEGAEIYYTLDGEDPTKASTKYTAPIEVEEYASIAAIAYKGDNASEISYGEYMACPIIEGFSMIPDLVNYVEEIGADVPFAMGINVTVAYHNGKNTYVTDGNGGYALIFDNSNTLAFEAGTQIMAGWTGKITKFNGLTELLPDAPADLEADGIMPVPEPADMNESIGQVMSNPLAYEAMYVKLSGVTFDAATPANTGSFTGKIGEGDDAVEVTFYNRFKLESVEAGTYDVVGFVGYYKSSNSDPDEPGTAQIYVTSIEAATAPEVANVYAVGDFQDWNIDEPAVFTYDEGANYYVLTLTTEASELKISTKKGSWAEFDAGAIVPVDALENGTWTDFQAGTANINLPWKGVYTIYVNLDNEMIKVVTETPVPEEGGVYAVGDFQGWNPASPTVLTYDETEGCYVLSFESDEEGVDPIEISSLKLSTAKGTWDAFNAAAFVPAVALQNDVWTGFVAGDGNIDLPWKGVYTIYVNLDLKMIKAVTETPEPEEPEYAELYVRGGMNDWGAVEAWMLATTDGVEYSLDKAVIAAGTEFKVADADWSANYDFGGVQDMDINTEYTLEPKGGNCTLKVDFNGKIVFNLEQKTIKFEMQADGINGIEAEAGEVEYYNLQGVKVMNPAAGSIVIRIQGGKATKVIM